MFELSPRVDERSEQGIQLKFLAEPVRATVSPSENLHLPCKFEVVQRSNEDGSVKPHQARSKKHTQKYRWGLPEGRRSFDEDFPAVDPEAYHIGCQMVQIVVYEHRINHGDDGSVVNGECVSMIL
mmetsp:Transcript_5014/g.10578  ORF Transcript_5014/g.10578 Transcript_5014/m.10578 type:complete len:125 (-) Transcript_5014:134-508(-)